MNQFLGPLNSQGAISAGYEVNGTSVVDKNGNWVGPVIPLAEGGTAAALTANNGGIFYSTATAGAILAGTATAGKALLSGATGAPSWSTPTYPSASGNAGQIIRSDGTNNVYTTATYPATTTNKRLLASTADNVIGEVATANYGLLNTDSGGAPSVTATPVVGMNLTIGGTGPAADGALKLAGKTSGTVTVTVADAAGTWTATLPTSAGNANQILQTDGNGVLSWVNTAANPMTGPGDMIYGGVAGVETRLAATATANLALVSGANAAPSWWVPTQGSIIFAGASGALAQDNAQLFWDDTNHRLGIGTATPGFTLDIEAAPTTTTGFIMAKGKNAINPSGASSSTYTAIEGWTQNSSAQSITGYAIGIYGIAENVATSGTFGNAYASSAISKQTGNGGTITNAHTFDGYVEADTGGTITNAAIFYGHTPIITGTITNAYGLYLEAITGATTNYSIYSAGGQSYHAGNWLQPQTATGNQGPNVQQVDQWIDSVISGLLPTTPSPASATMTTPSGYAVVKGARVVATSTAVTYPASQDVYVDISDAVPFSVSASKTVTTGAVTTDGNYTYTSVANNANAPVVAANSIRLFKVVSGAAGSQTGTNQSGDTTHTEGGNPQYSISGGTAGNSYTLQVAGFPNAGTISWNGVASAGSPYNGWPTSTQITINGGAGAGTITFTTENTGPGPNTYNDTILINSGSSSVTSVTDLRPLPEVTPDRSFGIALPAPTNGAASTSAGGGGWGATGNYYYKVTAGDGTGETVGSVEFSVNVSATTQTVNLSWNPVSGATQYTVYRTTSSGVYGTATLVKTLTGTATAGTSITTSDTGTATTAGFPPATTNAYGTIFPAPGASTPANAWNVATSTATSGTIIGLNSVLRASPGAGSTGTFYALEGYGYGNSNQNVTSLSGIFALGENASSSATLTNLYGVISHALQSGAGTTTNAHAVDAIVQATAGTITASSGIYVHNPTGGGTITTNYGLYLENQTTGATNWAIYSAGGASYHAGKLLLGSTVDHSSEQLQVTGSSYLNGDVAMVGALSGVTNFSSNGNLSIDGMTDGGSYFHGTLFGALSIKFEQDRAAGADSAPNGDGTYFGFYQRSGGSYSNNSRFGGVTDSGGSDSGRLEFYTKTSGQAIVETMRLNSAGQLILKTSGSGLSIKTGVNCKMGTGTLTAGSATISTTAVTANSIIFLTDTQAGVANLGVLTVKTITGGVSFVVESSNASDTSTFNWIIFEPS
ncbi:hypothetical protein KGP36_04045 [Patescibacteria group bacterium]|nr:hypothetical protein [Patescibacteria group bacterium]